MKNKFKKVRVRFAPSPTGLFHVGSARTALFNFLFARKNRGEFILRIEDTDRERSKREYEEDIMRSLDWMGVSWDEGPYRQSERKEVYRKHLLRLIEEGKAYYCFCTKKQLEGAKEKQRKRKEPPRYEGKCFSLSNTKRERLIKEGKEFVVRLRIPEDENLEFNDRIKGKIKFNAKDIGGDFVIAKGDLSTLYNFVCAIDDHEMKITHVIRGEDHLSNTPKQILIQRALKFNAPEFAHMALTLGTDKSKLSKRHGAVSLGEYMEKGYLPEAFVNFIALLGWHPGGENEIYSLDEIIEKFSLDDCQKSGAIFDIRKLEYINGYYIRKMKTEKLANLCIPYLVSAGLLSTEFEEEQYPPAYGGVQPKLSYHIPASQEKVTFDKIVEIISLYQERMKLLSETKDLVDYFFLEEVDYEKNLLFWKGAGEEETKKNLEKCISVISSFKKWDKSLIEKTLLKKAGEGGDRGKMLWPLRVALSGKKASAGPFDIIWVLGREKTLKRLKTAINKLKMD